MFPRIRIPKPTHLRSRLAPRPSLDAASYQVLASLAESYQLGEVRACRRAPRSNSLNFFVTTPRGKFVFRRHNLPQESVAYEHQILEYLQRRDFPAPRMLTNQTGRAWSEINGSLYSVYEFAAGYCPTDFVWLPATRRDIVVQCGYTLGQYHQAIAGLVPTAYKWNGYRPDEHKRWREGDWFRQVVADIRPLLQKPGATSPMDDFARARLDEIERMLELEPVVEERSDLSKLVIHGDYAPWNVLFHRGRPSLVLDFNESRLDLKVYDVMLATFWYAWREGRLNPSRVQALQGGYCQANSLNQADVNLAGDVFQWIMARSLIERLHIHYLQRRALVNGPTSMEDQCKMCTLARQHPEQLVAGFENNGVKR